jgi:hypothetical protein
MHKNIQALSIIGNISFFIDSHHHKAKPPTFYLAALALAFQYQYC